MSSELTTSGTTPAPTEIVTERIFDAPRQLIFETYVDPLYIPQFWGPRNTTTVVDRWTSDLDDSGALCTILAPTRRRPFAVSTWT